MSNADDVFWRQFGIILAILTVFTVVVFFIARSIGGEAFATMMDEQTSIEARIAPVAKIRIGDPAETVAVAAPAAPAAAPAATGEADGAAVYASSCVACHAAGVAGAPKFGDEAAWDPRLAVGEDALVASVVNGKGAMPPKAGNPALTEAQLRAAVQYMVAAVVGAPTPPAPGAEPKEATPPAAQAAAPAAPDTPAAAPAAPAAQVAAANAGKPGDETYNSLCMACHLSGAAGAPKLDDKDAWSTRAATGFASLVGSVMNGKGAMPPKGGNPTLQQADVENAVRYMLQQAGVNAAGS